MKNESQIVRLDYNPITGAIYYCEPIYENRSNRKDRRAKAKNKKNG